MTLNEIARRLGRSESTIRHWRRSYDDLLGREMGSSGHPVYLLDVFEQIEELRRQRRTPREVRDEILRRRADPTEASPSVTDILNLVLSELQAIRASVDWLVEQERGREERERGEGEATGK